MFGRSRQRGAAMLVMMALIAMGASWMLLTSLNAGTSRTAADRMHNAKVMAEAKQALLAWVAANALETSEDNPGRFPCPETAAYYGTANEGIMAGFCGPTATVQVGRLPWRSLGLPKLLDAAGEPLWYVVGNSATTDWTRYSGTAVLKINSDSQGQLSVDGQGNAAIALIIAPGQRLNVATSTNCTARAQARNTASLDLRDYLECQNASSPADTTFATTGPEGSFNDQVLPVTARDVMPLLEAAIAKRIERDIVPVLKTVYAGSDWGLSATDTVFPFAAPFADPSTSNFRGVAGQMQGLLPFSYYRDNAANCLFTGDPRCTTTAITWGTPSAAKTAGSGSLWSAPSCTAVTSGTPDYASCTGWYQSGTMTITLTDPAQDLAMAMRKFTTSDHYVVVSAWRYTYQWWCSCWTTTTMSPTSTTLARAFTSGGAVNFTATVALPSISSSDWGYFQIDAYRPLFSDHAILDTASAATSWFQRNEWHKFVYYAIAPAQAASGGSPRNCQDASSNCITVANLAGSNKRAILVLAGRSLANASRPNGTLSDYVDSADNRDGNTSFTQDKVGPATNDRIIVLDQSS